MPTLISHGRIEAQDKWTLLKEATDPDVLQVVQGKNLILPLQFWKTYRQEADDYSGDIALWLDSHEYVNDIGPALHDFPLIALNFPVFADGRAYTNARELREQLKYEGQIRAIGDVLRDQIYYMSRCGFDAFALRHDQDPEACLAAFNDFNTGYQASIADPLPLFRRR